LPVLQDQQELLALQVRLEVLQELLALLVLEVLLVRQDLLLLERKGRKVLKVQLVQRVDKVLKDQLVVEDH
jgi:hypothetical protein